MAVLVPPCRVIDDFLDGDVAGGLLAQILAAEPDFRAAMVGPGDEAAVNRTFRSALLLPGRTGVDLEPFKAAVHARFADLCAGAGMQPFDIYHTECSITAYGEGDFYRTHIDTRTGSRETLGHVRVLSCVYYLHREPPAFSGGALALHPFGGAREGAPATFIEPKHNRLAAFPSFVLHEVMPVVAAGAGFADRRFAINCWLHRRVDG